MDFLEAMRIWTARILLGFVMVTIGFAAGRRTAPAPEGVPVAATTTQAGRSGQVVLVAAHMTFRCPECNQIEWYARELVEREFAEELESGQLVFRTVDYMRDATFARRYDISSSTLVLIRVADGEEQGYTRLDQVWTMVRDREAYFDYVRGSVQDSLAAMGGGP